LLSPSLGAGDAAVDMFADIVEYTEPVLDKMGWREAVRAKFLG